MPPTRPPNPQDVEGTPQVHLVLLLLLLLLLAFLHLFCADFSKAESVLVLKNIYFFFACQLSTSGSLSR